MKNKEKKKNRKERTKKMNCAWISYVGVRSYVAVFGG